MKAKPGRAERPKGIGDSYRFVGLGWTFAGGIVMFTLAGWWLDGWLGFTPFLTVAGALLGAVLGFLHVYFTVMGEGEISKGSEAEGGK